MCIRDRATAESFGLINRSVPHDLLIEETQFLADRIASRSSQAIAGGKSAFYQQIEMPLPDAFTYANEVMLDGMTSSDSRAGVKAFMEKREHKWN